MRLPDIEALLYHHQNGNLQATINLMSLFCRAEGCDDFRIREAMASILKKLGAQVHIAHAERNAAMQKRLDIEERDRGNRTRAYQSLSGSDGLSVKRIRNIDRGEFTDNPIGDFVVAPARATGRVLSVAQAEIAKIRKLLLSESGRGRAALAEVTARGQRGIGKTILHEEIYQEVETLRRQGVKEEKAVATISAISGLQPGNVKKIHQRVKRKVRTSGKRNRDELHEALSGAEATYRKRNPTEPHMAIPSEAEMLDALGEQSLIGYRNQRDE